MNPADAIKTEPLLFDKLLEPISAPLKLLDQHPISQAAKKLMYAAFVRVLLFRVFDQIRSLRDLILDLKTKPETRLLNLPIIGLSALHDGFARYPVGWLISLIQHLIANHPLAEVSELKALGEVSRGRLFLLADRQPTRLACPSGTPGRPIASRLVAQHDVRRRLSADLRCRIEFVRKGLLA